MKGMASEVYEGWVAIARALGVACEETAVAYARLSVDPLPVVMRRGTPTISAQRLEEWRARRYGGLMRDGTMLERVEGTATIAARLDVSERTLLRLARLPIDPLPIYGRRRARWTYEASIRDWLDRRTVPFQAVDRPRAA